MGQSAVNGKQAKRVMRNPAAFVGKVIDSTKWAIPEGYAKCEMTGKLHAFEQLEHTFAHYAFPKAFLIANRIYVEDAAWLSEEGYDLIMGKLDALGLYDAYRSWFDGDMRNEIDIVPVSTPAAQEPAEKPLIPADPVGATVVYDDPGAWAYTPAKMRTGVIVSAEPSKYHGRYFLVEVETGKLPRRITEAQVIAFARVNQAALTAIGA